MHERKPSVSIHRGDPGQLLADRPLKRRARAVRTRAVRRRPGASRSPRRGRR